MTFVKEFVRNKSAGVRESFTLQRACRAIVKENTSGLPVVGPDREPLGFISQRDIVRAISRSGAAGLTVRDAMRRDVLTVEEDAPLEYVSKIFSEKQYRYIPVTRRGKVVGMINRREVMGNVLNHYY